MLIIGITGTLGAGKGTVVEYLVREKGFVHYSVRAFLLEEINRRGMPGNRDSMVVVANDLRHRHGPSFVTDCLYYEAVKSGKPCIIESIRTTGEILSLREKGRFILLAVDADPELRFRRISERGSETDRIDYETFLSNEAREMTASDPGVQNLKACMELAEYKLINNGSREELFRQTEEILAKIT